MLAHEMDWSKLAALAPVWVVLFAALIVVFLDLVLPHKERYILPWVGMAGCVLGLVSALQTYAAYSEATRWFLRFDIPLRDVDQFPLILGGSFCLDSFGMLIWSVACLGGALSLLC